VCSISFRFPIAFFGPRSASITQLAPRASARAALSASALSEKTAAVLLFGQRHNRRGAGFEKEYEK
jgi:hypothetical protein